MRDMLRCCLWGLALLPLTGSWTTAQERVLIGRSVDGGIVFQTLIHRGTSRVRTRMEASGKGSRTESHARLDDTSPEGTRPDPAQDPEPQDPEPQDPEPQGPRAPAAAGGRADESAGRAGELATHLLVRRDDTGLWRSLGLTADLAQAKHTVAILRQVGADAHVFQFLPLPPGQDGSRLIPDRQVEGLAVALSGQAYAVTSSGELFVLGRDSALPPAPARAARP